MTQAGMDRVRVGRLLAEKGIHLSWLGPPVVPFTVSFLGRVPLLN